ncbi:major facilitator superfamily domain-containing protein [Lipomyces orientalis]|uniref:Major facilitator superfamily domain-containing protein n=1 Tax=Lipomyces orientalis TaxID=1233043 RepID=A0ACC3THE8_9ASCO
MADIEKKNGPGHEETVSQPSQAYHLVHIDPAVQKRVVTKLDLNIMPLVVALYLMSFLDRSNIGNADTAGMSKGIHETNAQFQWLLTIFYIPYILFEWLALMWKVVPPHIWAFACVFVWGLAATLQAVAFNWRAMMVCRFFLAVAEAGYGPGIPYLLSFFYMRHEIGLRCGIFLSAAPFATCFASALAYGITSGHSHLANWRLLFLVEGLPSILMSFVAFFFLPDSPEKSRFLTKEEQDTAKARAIRQVGQEGASRVGSISFNDVRAALMDPKNWLTALMYFSCNVSFSSLPVFLPTILTQMGFTSIHAQGLSAPPYFLSFLLCIFSTWIADRTSQRGLVIIILSCIGGTGYVLLATCWSVGVRYFGIFLATAGIFPAIANILPWVLNNQGTDTKRGVGIALLQMIGQCGPILGTRLYPATEKPRYVKGMAVCAAFMFFNAFLALVLRTYLIWQNKKANEREAEVAAVMERDGKPQTEAVENEGYGFRNIL